MFDAWVWVVGWGSVVVVADDEAAAFDFGEPCGDVAVDCLVGVFGVDHDDVEGFIWVVFGGFLAWFLLMLNLPQ